jgi:mannose-1-phosphate guanylyltransferase/mannose-1-phosphate guanylyltransferase/mannose-6-phosphate isomerase
MEDLVQPIILAGGAGTRLWPLSTETRPKHLMQITGDRSMLEQTLDRVADEGLFLPPMIVAADAQADEIRAVAPSAELILEPKPCGSAAAIAFAALSVPADTILLVLPSDHYIVNPAPLFGAVRQGMEAAKCGRLVTFGIKPSRAEAGYGYITAGEPLLPGVREVRSFVEKPDMARASELVESGDAYWNSGMFSASAFLDELQKHAPEIHEAARSAIEGASKERSEIRPDGRALDDCPSISIDYAVMERSDRIAVVPANLDWSDVGSWAAIFELAAKDGEGNVVSANCRALDSHGCLIRSEGPQIVAIGVEDLVVIATADHVLVVPKSEAQRVREAAELAKRR